MVLTKDELIGQLKYEVHVLLHLAGKVDKTKLDYKPSKTQRSTLELLQYLNIMGPNLVPGIKAGAFDGAAWGEAVKASAALDYDGVVASIAKQADFYEKELGKWTDADFRGEIELFGQKGSRGSFLINLVKGGHAAYRTQLFCNLKGSGQDQLNTMNLWAGVDGPV